MIELQNVSYAIGENTILHSLNWQVREGQHALMLGASGSGKTTLLHLLAGLLTPTSGAVVVENIAALEGSAKDAWRGKHKRFVLCKFGSISI